VQKQSQTSLKAKQQSSASLKARQKTPTTIKARPSISTTLKSQPQISATLKIQPKFSTIIIPKVKEKLSLTEQLTINNYLQKCYLDDNVDSVPIIIKSNQKALKIDLDSTTQQNLSTPFHPTPTPFQDAEQRILTPLLSAESQLSTPIQEAGEQFSTPIQEAEEQILTPLLSAELQLSTPIQEAGPQFFTPIQDAEQEPLMPVSEEQQNPTAHQANQLFPPTLATHSKHDIVSQQYNSGNIDMARFCSENRDFMAAQQSYNTTCLKWMAKLEQNVDILGQKMDKNNRKTLEKRDKIFKLPKIQTVLQTIELDRELESSETQAHFVSILFIKMNQSFFFTSFFDLFFYPDCIFKKICFKHFSQIRS
jgi:hypothetical protein